MIFYNSAEYHSALYLWLYFTIGLDNELAPNRYQAIVHVAKMNYNIPDQGPSHYRGLTLIPAWISNYIHRKV